jgi:ADP-ribosylglycohydrolase
MIINRDEYRKKVLGCWMGKNIGGTLGAPFEWRRQVNNVSFYAQDLKGDPMPNDDLDIQLIWLIAMEEKGVEIDSQTLGEYWGIFVTPHWVEYGNAKINMRMGLLPPISGTFNNEFKDSCGAYIRSEIWACVTPGCPSMAARYAYEDAIIDHGNGEGTYAEVFCATLESAAFVESDIRKLIDIGLSYIPADCAVAGAVKQAIADFEAGETWREARDHMIEKWRGRMAFNSPNTVSPEDLARGWDEGKLGWDVPSNIGITVIGLLWGGGDFAKTLTTAVNCGEDTDCTAATAGSILGIMHGIDVVPEKWIAPIGRKIKTAFLNLGELGFFGAQLPQDVDNLTDRTERIARQVLGRWRLPVEFSDGKPTDLTDLKKESLCASDQGAYLYRNLGGPVFRFPMFNVAVDYCDGPLVADGMAKTIKLRIFNTYKIQANVQVRWHMPEGWQALPSPLGSAYVGAGFLGSRVDMEFRLRADKVTSNVTRLAAELVVDSRPTTMLVPVVLVNGTVPSDRPH